MLLRKISIAKKIVLVLVLLCLTAIIWNFELITYGINQGIGQLKIVWNTRPVAEVLKDPSFPDSLKTKIKLVEEIRQFAFDSLGINFSKNYTTLYDQKNKPILWVITACQPFQLKAKEWEFPFLGTVSYKGFFNIEKAKAEENILKQQGLETSLDEVAGWSTLGWFQDPILSNMLKRYPGSLANLIIHELTHGTLYVKDNVDFNENLASFVGDHGAEIFLKAKYGDASSELIKYQKRKAFYKQYSQLVLGQSIRLNALYNSWKKEIPIKEKIKVKKVFFANAIQELVQLYKVNQMYYPQLEKDLKKINNTFYMDEKRYREKQNYFEVEFKTKFHSNFKSYLNYLKEKYPSV